MHVHKELEVQLSAAMQSESHSPIWQMIRTSAIYFALVFAAGFAPGTVRVLWVMPRLGDRGAEFLAMPLTLAVSFFSRWVMWQMRIPSRPGLRLAIGGLAQTLLLMDELKLVLALRGLTLGEYFASRDAECGVAYALSLILFVLVSLLLLAASQPVPHRQLT